jgi:hypothetical protein
MRWRATELPKVRAKWEAKARKSNMSIREYARTRLGAAASEASE